MPPSLHRRGPLAAAAALAVAAHASAQSPTDGKAQLEAVVISGTKRVEKLDRVPASISVLNAEIIERNNVKDIGDVAALIPSITVYNAPSTVGNNSINMRGVGTASFTIGVSSDVAVLIDDVPIGMQVRAFQDLADLSRIEVLKGPQSTLFGRSAIAGAINVVSKPISNKAGGSAMAALSNDGEYRLRASYDAPLSETFGLRVALGRNDFRGLVRNLERNSWANGNESTTAMLKARWEPVKNLEIEFSPRYNNTVSDCCVTPINYLDPQAAYYGSVVASRVPEWPVDRVLAGIHVNPRNLEIRHDLRTFQSLKSYGGGLKVSYHLDNGFTLTSITGAERFDSADGNDGDGTIVPVFSYLTRPDGTPNPAAKGQFYNGTFQLKSVSQEFRLTSPDAGPVKYVLGAWYARNFIDRFFSRGLGDLAGSSPKEYRTDVFNRNVALFGNGSWDIDEHYTLGAGLRLNREVSGYLYKSGLSAPYPNGQFTPTINLSGVDGRLGTPTATDDVVTGKLSLQRKFSAALMGFVSYSTGYKGYGYDLLSSTDRLRASIQPVDPETAKSWEIGARGNFLGNTLTVSASLFHTKFKNFQSTSSVLVTDPVTKIDQFLPYLNSLGTVQTQGLELDVSWLVSRQLLVNAAYAYTDASIVEYPFGDCYAVPGSPTGLNDNCVIKNPARGGANTSDKAGNPLPQSPRQKLSISAQYDQALPAMPFDAFVTASTRIQSKTHLDLMNPTRTLPGYAITNLGLGVKSKTGRHKLTLNINNLFDKTSAHAQFTNFGTYVKADGKTPVTSGTWFPARDALRYFSVRFDTSF